MFNKKSVSPVTQSTPVKSEICSVIAQDMVINGGLSSRGRVMIDGSVHADVTADVVIVGEKGKVSGDVIAREVRLLGSVYGNIICSTVAIGKVGFIDGTIEHEKISVDEGATIMAHIKKKEFNSDFLNSLLGGNEEVVSNPGSNVTSINSISRPANGWKPKDEVIAGVESATA